MRLLLSSVAFLVLLASVVAGHRLRHHGHDHLRRKIHELRQKHARHQLHNKKLHFLSELSTELPTAVEETPEVETKFVRNSEKQIDNIDDLRKKFKYDEKSKLPILPDPFVDYTTRLPQKDDTFQPVPMPTDFSSYDQDGNGQITLNELIKVTGAVENVGKAFSASDIDGDGKINKDEFELAPWKLQGDPERNTNLSELRHKIEQEMTSESTSTSTETMTTATTPPIITTTTTPPLGHDEIIFEEYFEDDADDLEDWSSEDINNPL